MRPHGPGGRQRRLGPIEEGTEQGGDGLDRGRLLLGGHLHVPGRQEPERAPDLFGHGRAHGRGCATS